MILLSPKQNEIAADNTRFRVICAGRRFGKTLLAVEEMIGVAVSGNDKRIAYIAPTFQQARDIAWENLKKRCQPLVVDINESQLKIVVKTQKGGTSTIMLKSWDAIETLRGQSFHFLVLDEVAMMRYFWNGWFEVLRPALTDTMGSVMFISTPKGYNHFYDLYMMDHKDKSYKSFHATTYDNPHIQPTELEDARKQLTEDIFAQEYLADFRKQEGLVYKEFEREKHIFDNYTKRAEVNDIMVAVDFGYTNPTAVLRIERDKDNHYWVTQEWYKTGKTTPEIIEQVKSHNPNYVYADPAEPDRIEEMTRAGIYVRDVSKDIVSGINSVRELFKQNRLHIHNGCSNLINELENYRYPEKREDRNEYEVPIKENDHALDALRYCLHMQNGNSPRFDEEDISLYAFDYS
jgi:PBSX family phage terminase large subunit